MAADGLGAVLLLGKRVAGDDLEGMLKHVGHVVPVEFLAAAGGIRLLQVGADVLAAPDVDLEAALHPQQGLDHPVDVVAVGLPHLRRAVDKGFAHRHLSAGPLHGQSQGLLGVLEKRVVERIQGHVPGVQLGGMLQVDLDAITIHFTVPPSNINSPRRGAVFHPVIIAQGGPPVTHFRQKREKNFRKYFC